MITYEAVKEAVDKNKVQVISGFWGFMEGDKVTFACPICQLYMADGGKIYKAGRPDQFSDSVNQGPVIAWANAKYGEKYVTGFIIGFDGKRLPNPDHEPVDTVLGHEDGAKIRKKLYA